MVVLFEARSIIPNKSGGIENYLYMLLRGWKNCFPKDELKIIIQPRTENDFKTIIGSEIQLVIDPVYKFVYMYILQNLVLRKSIGLVTKLKCFKKYLYGSRKSWIKRIDAKVDVVIYPYHREEIMHDPSKSIFVMHDFRIWDFPNKNRKAIQMQKKAITKIAAVVCSWPYPFRRLNEEFPEIKSKFFEVPFLFESSINNLEDNKIGNYLYYPAGLGEHKNHINLIKALRIYNDTNKNKLRLIFSGTEKKEIKERLSYLISILNMEKFITFKGYIKRNEVYELYKNCYAVVSSSLYEAVSGPILEAFEFEKPVIASSIRPNIEFLNKYNINIPLFDPLNPDNIANVLRYLVDNYEKIHKKSLDGKRALKFITDKYTVVKFRNIASNLINKKR